MGVEVKNRGDLGSNNNVFQRSAIVDPKLLSEISFDCGGSWTRLATAPEAASTIKTATHGFSVVTAADGHEALQFIKTRDDGTTVTYQICEGTQGTPYYALARYGNEELKGATLRYNSEFEEMVDELLKEVKGLMISGRERELQTEDEGLKLAFKLVNRGVRTIDRGTECSGLWVKFLTEYKGGERIVSGREIRRLSELLIRQDGDMPEKCGFFGVSSPES